MTQQFEPGQDATAADCPRCGADNRCDRAAGGSGLDCWCLVVTPAPGALDGLPPQAAARCLCRACLSPEEHTDAQG